MTIKEGMDHLRHWKPAALSYHQTLSPIATCTYSSKCCHHQTWKLPLLVTLGTNVSAVAIPELHRWPIVLPRHSACNPSPKWPSWLVHSCSTTSQKVLALIVALACEKLACPHPETPWAPCMLQQRTAQQRDCCGKVLLKDPIHDLPPRPFWHQRSWPKLGWWLKQPWHGGNLWRSAPPRHTQSTCPLCCPSWSPPQVDGRSYEASSPQPSSVWPCTAKPVPHVLHEEHPSGHSPPRRNFHPQWAPPATPAPIRPTWIVALLSPLRGDLKTIQLHSIGCPTIPVVRAHASSFPVAQALVNVLDPQDPIGLHKATSTDCSPQSPLDRYQAPLPVECPQRPSSRHTAHAPFTPGTGSWQPKAAIKLKRAPWTMKGKQGSCVDCFHNYPSSPSILPRRHSSSPCGTTSCFRCSSDFPVESQRSSAMMSWWIRCCTDRGWCPANITVQSGHLHAMSSHWLCYISISRMFFVLHPSFIGKLPRSHWWSFFDCLVFWHVKTSSKPKKWSSLSRAGATWCNPGSVRLLAVACHKMPRPAKSVEDRDPTVDASVRSVATSSAKNSACLANHVGKILFEDVKTKFEK